MDNCYTNFTANEESFDDESEEKKDVYEELPQPNRESYSEWIYKGNNGFYPSKYLDIRKKLPNGYYIFKFSSRENTHYLEKQNFFTDNLIDLPIPELQAVKRDIIKFWESKDIFDKYDLVYKRGILLHGPGGCGKTAMIEIILKDLIEKRDGIVFKINSSDTLSDYDQSFNNMIRVIEPNRKVITVIEDIDGLLTEKDDETVLLNILDGMNQSNNVLYLATTNHPEKLEERIMNRPSRFDRRYKIGKPNKEVREAYFNGVLKEEDKQKIDVKNWLLKTDGLSLSHLRELIISVIILGNDFEDTINVLTNMNEEKVSSRDYETSKAIGFK